MEMEDRAKLSGGGLLIVYGFIIMMVSWQLTLYSGPGPFCGFPSICLNTSKGIVSINLGALVGGIVIMRGLILLGKSNIFKHHK